MAQALQYLDDNGNPVKSVKPLAQTPGKVYLNPETGEPLDANQTTASVAPPPAVPAAQPSPAEGWRDRMTQVMPHAKPTPADYANSLAALRYTGREGVKALANIGGLGLSPFLHPVDTMQSLAASVIPSSLMRGSLDDWQKKVVEPWQKAHPGQPLPAGMETSDRDRSLAETPDPFTAVAASLMPPEAVEYGKSHGRAGDLRAKQARGEKLSADDQAYLDQATKLEAMGGHPIEALEGLAGQTASMHLASGLKSQLVSGARSAAEGAVRRLAGSGPGVARDLVRAAADKNRSIDVSNETRKADALADHKNKMIALKAKYDKAVREMEPSSEDKDAYWAKRQAAKQAYEQAVRDQVEKYTIEKAAAEKTNAEAQREYNRKIGQTVQQNRTATAAETAKAEQSAQLQVGGSKLIYGLSQLDKALRDRAGTMFDAVRDKVGAVSRPGADLGTRARAALTKISGSSTVPKPFSDILAKYPESDPEFIEDPTKGINSLGKVGKDSPYYELLKQRFGGGAAAPPVTFADLQGYYTETGAELAKGTLPGDVYQATKQLHNDIGDMMQEMANSAGAGKQFWDSRVFYRSYMDTFHEPTGPSSSGSPVAQALQAKDPLVAVDKFAGDSGDRGVADLRRFSDSLANLAQDVRQRAQAKVTVPARKSVVDIPVPKSKPVPTASSIPAPTKSPPVELDRPPQRGPVPLPPVLPPEPNPELIPRQTISEADLRRANEDSVRQHGSRVVGRLLTTSLAWPLWHMLSDITRGRAVSPGSLAALPAAGATGMAIEEILAHPDVNEFLTRPSRAQLAQIPLELRSRMPEIVAVAKSRGMQVSPLLVAYAAAMQRNKTGQAQQQAPPAQGVQQ